MISRAIEIDPGSSSRDGESLLQSPSAERLADLGPGEPGRLGDLAVRERQRGGGVADGRENSIITDRGNGQGWLPR